MIQTYSILELLIILMSSLKITEALVCQNQDESATNRLTDEEIEAQYALKPFLGKGLLSFSAVFKDKAFIDKTLFIKEFFTFPSSYTYLTAPPNFGKSINIDMLYRFFDEQTFENGTIQQRELSDNYKMFENTKLFREENDFFRQHAQQYKVVRLDFNPLKYAKDEQSFKEQLAKVICYAMQDHSSLKNLGSTVHWYTNIRECVESRQKETIEALQHAGADLCRELFDFYKKKIIVLADEYDAIPHVAIKENINPDVYYKLRDQFGGFIDPITKGDSNVVKGLFVGTHTFGGFFCGLADNVHHYYVSECPEFGTYFGFTQQNVDKLLERFQMTASANKVKAYFDGYTIKGLPHVSIYNPVSILKFLLEGDFDDRWTAKKGEGYPDLYEVELFLQPQIGDEIQRTLYGVAHSYEFQTGSPKWYVIRNIIKSGIGKTLRHTDLGLVLQYLYESGYFTRDKNKPGHQPVGENTNILTVPNFEMKVDLTSYLFDGTYLEHKLNLSMVETARIGIAVKNVAPNNAESVRELAEAIHLNFIHVCPIRDERTDFHGLLYGSLISFYVRHAVEGFDKVYVYTEAKIYRPTKKEVLNMKAEVQTKEKGEVKKRGKSGEKEAKSDLVVIADGVGMVMEFKRHKTSEDGLEQILRERRYDVFEKKFPDHKLKSKIYMGVNIAPNGTVTISYLCDNIEIKNAQKVQYPDGDGEEKEKQRKKQT